MLLGVTDGQDDGRRGFKPFRRENKENKENTHDAEDGETSHRRKASEVNTDEGRAYASILARMCSRRNFSDAASDIIAVRGHL